MSTSPVQNIPRCRPRAHTVRRTSADRSQHVRHVTQAAFLALNVWLGVQFLLWVRFIEHGAQGQPFTRPPGAEGWLPIAGLINFKYFLSTGRVPAIHPAAMFLFEAFVLMSLLLKKSFCAWLCPLGTASEALWKVGKRILGWNLQLPRKIDLPMRGLKYLLLSFFVLAVGAMSADSLESFMGSPYGLVADVKMLNFFRNMSLGAMMIFAGIVLGSLLIKNFWCRYFCPYGALMGLVSLVSPFKIRRDIEACVACGKCSRVCPSHLPVDELVQIRSAECNACMVCVEACSMSSALQFALPPRNAATSVQRWAGRRLDPLPLAVILAYLFFGFVLTARVTNHWQTSLPRSVYIELVPSVSQIARPGL